MRKPDNAEYIGVFTKLPAELVKEIKRAISRSLTSGDGELATQQQFFIRASHMLLTDLRKNSVS